MASHLTVTNTTGGTSTGKAFGMVADTGAEGGGGEAFASLLGSAAPGTETARTSTATTDINLGNGVKFSLGFGEGEAGTDADPDAIVAVIDTIVPAEDAAAALPGLGDIVEGLAALKARLDAGEPLDPGMLEELEAALAELAAGLDIDLETLPTLEDLTALVIDLHPDDASLAARLTAALGPLAETLFNGSAGQKADAGAELSAMVKSIGEKLAALLSALNSGEIDPEQLARLEAGADADTDLDAALARLLNPLPKVETGNAAPPLATPELKLTEPVLTGKPAAPADAAAEPAKASDTPERSGPVQSAAAAGEDASDRGSDTAGQERRPAEPRTAAAAAPADRQPEAQAAQQPPPAARVEIVAAPRVVQAGYQTSQQQLNLPQLAFEIVRQVGEGNTRFQIRLDPPELGRIDVKLDIDKAGQVNARLTVEKVETLDLMQRDQRALERALQQAGLEGNKTNLEFSLKQNPFGSGQQGDDRGANHHPAFGDEAQATGEDTPAPAVTLYRGNLSASGVNIIA